MNTSMSQPALQPARQSGRHSDPHADRQSGRQSGSSPRDDQSRHIILDTVGRSADRIGHDLLGLTVPLRAAIEVAAESGLDLATAPEACRLIERLGASLQMLAATERMSMTAELTSVYETMQPLLKATLPRGVQLSAELGEPGVAIDAGREALAQAIFRCCQAVGGEAVAGDRVVVRRDSASEPGHIALRFALETRDHRAADADPASKFLPQAGDPVLVSLGASIEAGAGPTILLTIPLSQ